MTRGIITNFLAMSAASTWDTAREVSRPTIEQVIATAALDVADGHPPAYRVGTQHGDNVHVEVLRRGDWVTLMVAQRSSIDVRFGPMFADELRAAAYRAKNR